MLRLQPCQLFSRPLHALDFYRRRPDSAAKSSSDHSRRWFKNFRKGSFFVRRRSFTISSTDSTSVRLKVVITASRAWGENLPHTRIAPDGSIWICRFVRVVTLQLKTV